MVNNVFFEPGARTHWHRHEVGQVLHVTVGAGWLQTRDGDGAPLTAGDTAHIPAGEEHWHGGAARHLHVAPRDLGRHDRVARRGTDEDYRRALEPAAEMLQVLLSGLAIGAIYGLVGMGFAIGFYVTRVINFAEGQLLMVAVMVAAAIARGGVSPVIAIIVGMIAAAPRRHRHLPGRRPPGAARSTASASPGSSARSASG